MKPPVIYLFVQHTCPEYPLITLNTDVCISATFSNMDVVYELTDSTYVLGETLAITALQTKVTRGRLSLIRIKDHQEQICRLSRCAWLVWVFSMVQCVPKARCPKILFCIVAKSLACFCRGCCVRRLTMLAISAFIRPCPKLQCAWDSFWYFPDATRSTACTQDHWSCNPHRAVRQKAIQGSMRNMQGTMRICWLFGLPSTQKLCTNHPHVTHGLMYFVNVPISQHAVTRSPQNPFSVKNRATNGKKSRLLHLLLLIYLKCQDDHNIMRTIQQLDLSSYGQESTVRAHWQHLCLATMGNTLAITACQTKVTMERIKDRKEQTCCFRHCTWLVWVFSMVQRVPTAGRCPKILFCIVTKSLACFCRGCCVRRLTMLAISAFIRPCPKLQYAWDSFWQFPVATHCTACTQDHWSCNPHRAVRQFGKRPYREAWGTCKEPWGFAGSLGCLQRRSYAPTILMSLMYFVNVPISQHAVTRSPQKPFSVKNRATNGKKSRLLHLLLLIYMKRQDDHNTMRTIQQLDLSRLWPLQRSGTVGKWHPFSHSVIQCAFPASKRLKTLELLKHAQLATHSAG